MLSGEDLFSFLRSALRYLYDPNALRASPLIDLLRLSQRPDPPRALRLTLVAAIEALQPKADIPLQSRAWRTYEILHCRYVEQYSQQEVSNQLGVGLRHLRREEREATLTLAHYLEREFGLQVDWEKGTGEQEVTEDVQDGDSAQKGEWSWMQELPVEDLVTLDRVLPSVVELVQRMAPQGNVRLEVAPGSEMPALAVNYVAVRQILLCLLTTAIEQSPTGSVVISAQARPRQVEVSIRGDGPGPSLANLANAGNVEMARRLANACGCELALSSEEGAFSATVSLPTLERLPVLVIEDNLDTVLLWQRYTLGTRYRLIGARDWEQAFALADKIAPRLILLDVMIPEVDGWELLGRLRHHPLTADLPIVVCSVLPQEELALALGATAFLHKPISRQALLSVLARSLPSANPSGLHVGSAPR